MFLLRTLIVTLFALPAAHAELTIFDVRKNLPMSDTEKVYRDFYVNGGSESGMTVGMIITVQRRMPLYDTYQNRSAGDLDLKVAKIKIIHVQKGLSVARMHSEYNRENSPLLEDNFVMVGDRLDLATAVQDKPDKKAESSDTPRNEANYTPPPAPMASFIPRGQIVVNSVDISSVGSQQAGPNPTPVEIPVQ